MIVVPAWVSLLVGSLVTAFGVFRLTLAFRRRGDQERAQKRGGLYGYSRHTQFLFGVVYIVMGLLLILPALGVSIPLPWRRSPPVR
jgi:uncharacterized membrane protein YidH (DUF202 family)